MRYLDATNRPVSAIGLPVGGKSEPSMAGGYWALCAGLRRPRAVGDRHDGVWTIDWSLDGSRYSTQAHSGTVHSASRCSFRGWPQPRQRCVAMSIRCVPR